MDEFSAGIQGPGGNAGEQSGERSEIEIFDFVNQKPDLTTMDKGLFIESGARNLPKRTQDSRESPGPDMKMRGRRSNFGTLSGEQKKNAGQSP